MSVPPPHAPRPYRGAVSPALPSHGTTPPTRGSDRYAGDVLAARRRPPVVEEVPAEPGLVVEEVTTGWCGAVLRCEKAGGMHVVVLEDSRLRTRTFPLGPDFLLEGRPVTLVRPRAAAPAPSGRTASGSVAVSGARARVARASRILVEGVHDAELVERVWGADLRVEGVVVGAPARRRRPGRGPARLPARDRAAGSGCSSTTSSPGPRSGARPRPSPARPALRDHVLVVGHPYVDVWQAVRPQRVGLDAWPVVPRGRPWKEGVLAHLGWPHATAQDVGRGWGRILGTVRSWTDLEPELLGRVEELIDFVTGDDADR